VIFYDMWVEFNMMTIVFATQNEIDQGNLTGEAAISEWQKIETLKNKLNDTGCACEDLR